MKLCNFQKSICYLLNELSRGSITDSSEVESAESAFTSVLISIVLPL